VSRGGTHLAHDWYAAPLPRNVLIGERSWFYSSFAFLHYQSTRPCGVRVGTDSGVYYTTFFELGPEGEVEIGDFCSIVGAIINTNGRVVIGDYAFIAHDVVIADQDAPAPPGSRDHDRAGASAEIVVGENAWIGTRAVLLRGASIGAGAIVGAGTVVDFDVPPLSVVAGNPAAIVGTID